MVITGHGGSIIISSNYVNAAIYYGSNPLLPWAGGYWSTEPAVTISGDNCIVTIRGNVIQNGSVGIEVTVTGSVTIENNFIYNNTDGIKVNTNAIIHNNNFEKNSNYNINSKTPNEIDATSNWWGTTDIQIIEQKIYDQKDFSDYGKVNYSPILSQPNPSAPNANFNPLTAPITVPTTSTPSPAPMPSPTQHPKSTFKPPTTQAPTTVPPGSTGLEGIFEFVANQERVIMTIISVLLIIIIALLVFLVRKQQRNGSNNNNKSAHFREPPCD